MAAQGNENALLFVNNFSLPVYKDSSTACVPCRGADKTGSFACRQKEACLVEDFSRS